MFQNEGYSLADIAAATGNQRDGMGWGADGGWFIWIILIFAIFGGWGNGFGFGGNGGNGALTRGELCQDMNFQSLENAVRGVQSGLCDGFYAQNTALMNGFHGVDNAICNLGYQTQQGFNTTNVALMQSQNALQSQLANCCCETREAIQGVNYNMAQNTCALQNTMNNNTRDIIDSQNAGTRAILDYLCQDKIATLQAENQTLKFQASQTSQNQFITQVGSDIVNRLQPPAIPAYVVPNPNAYGYGCSNGCSC